MKNKLLKVAEGIMDSAAKEYREFNLESYERVRDYAFNGMNIKLTKHECELILLLCKKMSELFENGEIPSQEKWYYDFKRILMDEDQIQI